MTSTLTMRKIHEDLGRHKAHLARDIKRVYKRLTELQGIKKNDPLTHDQIKLVNSAWGGTRVNYQLDYANRKIELMKNDLSEIHSMLSDILYAVNKLSINNDTDSRMDELDNSVSHLTKIEEVNNTVYKNFPKFPIK